MDGWIRISASSLLVIGWSDGRMDGNSSKSSACDYHCDCNHHYNNRTPSFA